jgi:hypothetical protein
MRLIGLREDDASDFVLDAVEGAVLEARATVFLFATEGDGAEADFFFIAKKDNEKRKGEELCA